MLKQTKKSTVILIAVSAVLVAAIFLGLFLMMKQKETPTMTNKISTSSPHIPAIDANRPNNVKTATFAMG